MSIIVQIIGLIVTLQKVILDKVFQRFDHHQRIIETIEHDKSFNMPDHLGLIAASKSSFIKAHSFSLRQIGSGS